MSFKRIWFRLGVAALVTLTSHSALATLSAPSTSSSGNYTVSWTSISTAYRYELYESANGGGTWTRIYHGTSLSYAVSGKPPGNYTYRLDYCTWELILGGGFEWCGWDSGYGTVTVVVGAAPPPTPTGLTGPDYDFNGTFQLSWNASSGATSYEVQSFPLGGGAFTTEYTGSSTNPTISGIADGTRLYQVRACAASNCSPWSASLSIGVENLERVIEPLTPLATTAVGTVPFTSGVSDMGDAQISVPLQVPPGVNGLAPQLALSYASGQGRDILAQTEVQGVLGYGWDLEGLSELRRCRVGTTGTVSLTSSDRLCMDGVPLVLTSGYYWGSGSTYETEVGHTRVNLQGSGNDIWFEVFTPDGHRIRYGDTTNSRVAPNGSSVPWLWSYRRHTDDFGNVLTVAYEKNSIFGMNFPKSITYGSATINFYYEERADTNQIVTPVPGVNRRAVALVRVLTRMSGTAVRNYRLDNVLSNGYLRLSTVQDCGYNEAGGGQKCLEPLDIEWTTLSSAGSAYQNVVTAVTSSFGDVTRFYYRLIDGDSTNNHSRHFSMPGLFGTYSQPSNVSTRPSDKHAFVYDYRIASGNGTNWRSVYYYHGYPLYADNNRGFVGFPGTREDLIDIPIYNTNTQAYVEHRRILYRQHRLDEHLYGRVARTWTRQYTPDAGNYRSISIKERDWQTKLLANGAVFSHVDMALDRNYELTSSLTDAQSSASRTDYSYCFRSLSSDTCPSSGTELSFPTQLVTTTSTGASHGADSGSPSVWGDVLPRAVSGQLDYKEIVANYDNNASSTYRAIGFVDKLITKSGVTSALVTNTAEFDRNATYSNRIETTTRFPGDTTYELVTTQTYNTQGNVTQTQVSGAGITTRSSSASSFLQNRYPQSITNAASHSSSLGYDLRFGTPDSITDPNGNASTVTRDEFGRVISSVAPDGTTTTVTYESCASVSCSFISWADARVRITTEIDNGGTQVAPDRRTYLDGRGQVVLTEAQAFSSSDGWVRVETHYDRLGRVRQSSLPYFSNGGTPEYNTNYYWFRGYLVRTDRPDGSTLTTSYYVNSGILNLIQTESGTGQSKRSYFNSLDQLTRTDDAFGTADEVSSLYTYDHRGGLNVVTVDGAQVADMDYDAVGNRWRIIEPASGTTTYVFDSLNQLIQATDNIGNNTRYTYDVLGRVTQRVDGWLGANTITNTYGWDTATNGIGLLASQANNVVSESFTYDSLSRLDVVSSTVSVSSFPGNGVHSIDHDYDSAGRLDSVLYPDSIRIDQTFTALGFPSEIRRNGTTLESIDAVNAFGQVTEKGYQSGLQNSRYYDPETGRLTWIETGTSSTPTSIQDLEYEWRTNGTLLTRKDKLGTTSTSDDRTDTFGYDELNRIKTQTSNLPGVTNRVLNFDYDDVGNLELKTSNIAGDVDATAYNYAGSANPYRLNNVTLNDGGGNVLNTLVYDSNGNITRYNAASGDDRFIDYDPANRATRITVGTSSSTSTPTARDEFWYGPNGERVVRKASWMDGTLESTWEMQLAGGAFERVYPVHETTINHRSRVYAGENVLIRHTETTTSTSTLVFYLFRDHLGSVDMVTNSSGATARDLSNDPFGARRDSDWSADDSSSTTTLQRNLDWYTPRGFTDHEHLDRTGIIHMNGRIYDPTIGRFLQPDPIVSRPDLTQRWNSYSYVMNSAMSLVDPTGFSPAEGSFVDESTKVPEVFGRGQYLPGGGNPFATGYNGDSIMTDTFGVSNGLGGELDVDESSPGTSLSCTASRIRCHQDRVRKKSAEAQQAQLRNELNRIDRLLNSEGFRAKLQAALRAARTGAEQRGGVNIFGVGIKIKDGNYVLSPKLATPDVADGLEDCAGFAGCTDIIQGAEALVIFVNSPFGTGYILDSHDIIRGPLETGAPGFIFFSRPGTDAVVQMPSGNMFELPKREVLVGDGGG